VAQKVARIEVKLLRGMIALLSTLFVASSAQDSTASDILLPEGSFMFASQKLRQGDLVRVSYATSGGVFSILNHTDYSLRVGFTTPGTTGMQWSEPSRLDGFYSMGASPIAVVEITATQDTEIVFSGCYIGGTCARVIAGHSQTSISMTSRPIPVP
jgi:hypothetical protein